MKRTSVRRALTVSAALALLSVAACSANDDGEPEGSASEDGSTTTRPDLTGPAPGVTDDAIKVGITYLDLEPIREIVDLDQGDYEASYQALIDEINDAGGIHGRLIEPVFAPISPIGSAPSEEACVRLTEDEDVFVAVGYFQDDAVLCTVADHATAVIGGNVTAARFEQAAAPWFTIEPGEDEEVDGVRTMAEAGELDGNLGVFASILNEADLEDVYLPLLEELGIEPVATAVLDAPFDDATAQNQSTAVIAERFESEGVDTILVIGTAGLPLANGLAPLDYRPLLRAPNGSGISAYAYGADPDFSIVDPAIVTGPDSAIFDEPAMQDCLGTLVEAGVEPEYIDPEDIELGERTPYNSALAACRQVALLKEILEAAGPDLNYGTFQAAGESLQDLHLPGAEDRYNFGPFPSNDGDLPMYLQQFDRDLNYFVRIEE